MTVVGNSWQNATMFNRQVTLQLQEGTMNTTATAARVIGSVLEHTRNELALVVNVALSGATDSEQQRAIETFLATNSEVVAVQLLQAPVKGGAYQAKLYSFNKTTPSVRFEGQDVEEFATLLQRRLSPLLRNKLGQKLRSDKPEVLGLSSITELPMLGLLLPYQLAGTKQLHWALVVIWSTRIEQALPPLDDTRIALVGKGRERLLTWSDEGLEKVKLPPLEAPVSAGEGLVFLKDEEERDWLRAYAKIEGYDASLVVERNARAQQLATSQIIRRSALWAWAFVLVAILFSFFGASTVTAQLRSLTEATLAIAAGNLKAAIPAKGQDEVTVLGASVQHMASRINNLMTEQVAKAQMQKELETAQEVQNALFPKAAEQQDGRIITRGFYQPASQCGGDWWGTYRLKDGSELIFIGDATGHGAGPALVTAMAYTSCKTVPALLEATSAEGELSPAAVLMMVNRLIYDAVGGRIGMTFFVGHFDTKRGRLRYANAGHNFPILYRAAGRGTAGDTQPLKAITVKGGGTPLGLESQSCYTDQEIGINQGDTFLFYTDGLIECTDSRARPFGRRKLLAAAEAALLGEVDTLVAHIKDQAFAHFGDEPLKDDVTIVASQIKQLG